MIYTQPGCNKLDPSKEYSQKELEAWVRRRHNVKERWVQPSTTLTCRDFELHTVRSMPLGERFCFIIGYYDGVWIVDLESKTPRARHLFEIPDGHLEAQALGYYIDTSQTPLTYVVAVAWSNSTPGYPARFHLLIYKFTGDSEPLPIQPHSKVVTPPRSLSAAAFFPEDGLCYEVILTERYVLRIVNNRGQYKIIINSNVGGLYSNNWVGVDISMKGYVESTSMLLDDRIMILCYEGLHIYDVSQMLSMPQRKVNSFPSTLPQLTPRIITLNFQQPLFSSHASHPHIDTWSTRVVLLCVDGLCGLEIPHDSTKPHTITPLKSLVSPVKWWGLGVGRSVIMYQDGVLETISHEWGSGLKTTVVVVQRSALDVPNLSDIYDGWTREGIFMENIGRVVGFSSQKCGILDI